MIKTSMLFSGISENSWPAPRRRQQNFLDRTLAVLPPSQGLHYTIIHISMLAASAALPYVSILLTNAAPVRLHWRDRVTSHESRHLFSLVLPDPRIKAALTLAENRSKSGRISQLQSLRVRQSFHHTGVRYFPKYLLLLVSSP